MEVSRGKRERVNDNETGVMVTFKTVFWILTNQEINELRTQHNNLQTQIFLRYTKLISCNVAVSLFFNSDVYVKRLNTSSTIRGYMLAVSKMAANYF